MAPSFSKHTILTGTLDYYCLVCETRFVTGDDTSKHIKTGNHLQELQKIPHDTPEDGIRKIKMWYYCEFCSAVLKTKPRVRLHILEPQHVANKINQYFIRYGDHIIAFDDLHIDSKAWDGLCNVTKTCILCNSEYENDLEHLKDPLHHINLIQNNIELNNKNIYRMVDETSFHCMTCNSLEALPIISHFDSDEHKKIYKKSQMLAAKILNTLNNEDEKILQNKQTQNQVTKQSKSADKDSQKESQIQGRVTKSISKSVDDEASSSDKIPKEGKNSKKTVNKIKRSSHKQVDIFPVQLHVIEATSVGLNKMQYDCQTENNDVCKVLRTDNYMSQNENGVPWCILCDRVIHNHKVLDHLSSFHHNSILELHEQRIQKFTTQHNEENIHTDRNNTSRHQSLDCDLVKMDEKVRKKSGDLSKFTNLFSTQVSKNGSQENISDHTDTTLEKINTSVSFEKLENSSEKLSNNNIDIEVKCKTYPTTESCDNESIEQDIPRQKELVSAETPRTQSVENKADIIDSLSKFQSDHICINFEMNSVMCKKCSVNLDFDAKMIEKHIIDHKKDKKNKNNNKPQKTSPPEVTEEENFANGNNFKVVLGQRIVSCDLCKIQISYSLKHMKEHLHSNGHKSLVEGNKIKLETTILEIFMTQMVLVRQGIYQDMIINEDICISVMSFNLILNCPELFTYRCLCCRMFVAMNEYESHLKTEKHYTISVNLKIVTNMKDEFIRQVSIGDSMGYSYHCGYCNIVLKNWQEMKSHLNTTVHKGSKSSAKWRLQEHSVFIASNIKNAVHNPKFTPDLLNNTFE